MTATRTMWCGALAVMLAAVATAACGGAEAPEAGPSGSPQQGGSAPPAGAPGPPGTAGDAPGEAPSGAEAPDAAGGDPVARWMARVPEEMLHQANACPFECCVYRDWTPTGEVPLRPEPSRSAPVALTIPAGETFRADSGFVRVTRASLVAVTEPVLAEGPGGEPFLPGDTLVVLDYVGEGFQNVWDGERVREISIFWGPAVGPDAKGEEIGADRYAREWWVHATTRAGRRGWFDADSVARLQGADACGG